MTELDVKQITKCINEMEELGSNFEKVIVKHIETIYNCASVSTLDKADDVPYDKEDFVFASQHGAQYLLLLQEFLEKLISVVENSRFQLSHTSFNIVVVRSIVLASQYHNGSAEWGTPAACTASAAVLDLLLTSKKGSNATGFEILEGKLFLHSRDRLEAPGMGPKPKYKFGAAIKPLLQHLSTKFTKKLWKNDPGTIEFYIWMLYNLSFSDLSEHLGYLLPGALLLLDDWEQRNKLTGLQALQHILTFVAGSELRVSGRAAVMFEAAKHHLYCREPLMLDVAYPVAVSAAVVLQADPAVIHSVSHTPAEEVLLVLLREMTCEQRLDLRKVFARHLPAAAAAARLRALRYSRELIEVFTGYLTTYEGQQAQDRVSTLQAVQVYVRHCWPQASRDTEDLLKAIVQLLYDVANQDKPVTSQARAHLLQECRATVLLLMHAQPQPKSKTELTLGLAELVLPPGVRKNVDAVFGDL